MYTLRIYDNGTYAKIYIDMHMSINTHRYSKYCEGNFRKKNVFLDTTPQKAAAVRPPTTITKTIQVRRTRHVGHCWRSSDELISDVLL